MDLCVLPPEIIINVLEHLPLADLVRAESTSRMIQAFCHCEIERRLMNGPLRDEWNVLIHLDQAVATPTRFDARTKEVTYAIAMKPIEIKTMYDHKRQIHCSLLRKSRQSQYQFHEQFQFTLDKGLAEDAPVDIAAQGTKLCAVDGTITRLLTHATQIVDDKKRIAPRPIKYALQVTEMRLPLSTLAA